MSLAVLFDGSGSLSTGVPALVSTDVIVGSTAQTPRAADFCGGSLLCSSGGWMEGSSVCWSCLL